MARVVLSLRDGASCEQRFSRRREKEFKARSETLLAPVQTRINEALKAFAIANNATIVLDGARFNSAVLAMKAGVDPASLDLTAAFVDSYNRTHP